MTMLNINNGEDLIKIEFDKVQQEIEFLEQFNEKILIKLRNKPLKIYNVLDR